MSRYRIKLTDVGKASQEDVSINTAFSHCANYEVRNFQRHEHHKQWLARNGENTDHLPNIPEPSSEVTLSTDYEFYDSDD